jgi:hypothetical protein
MFSDDRHNVRALIPQDYKIYPCICQQGIYLYLKRHLKHVLPFLEDYSINYIMSVRRKSCETCFQGRRKCDLSYPVCKRCQRSKKSCHYIRTPPTTKKSAPDIAGGAIDRSLDTTNYIDWAVCSPGPLRQQEDDVWDTAFIFDLQQSNLLDEMLYPHVPSFLGDLGEIQPVSGNNQSWEWVIEQLKSYPWTFAQYVETTFIHKKLYRDLLPSSIRAAFGVCTAYVYVNDATESMLFRTLDAEASELLNRAPDGTLLEALSRMQAMVLYQIIRIYRGDLRQRAIAEQQGSILGMWGLQLIHRADIELRSEKLSWESRILAESVRRTVMVAFMLHGVYSIFKHGICPEFPTLSILPVSTKTTLWNSEDTNLQLHDQDETMKYRDFTELWLASPKRKLESFEKMLLVACKGIEQVELLSLPDGPT